MRPHVVVGISDPEGFRPSPQFRAEWSGFPPLPPALIFADREGKAKPVFRGMWRQRYGTTLSPVERLVDPSGEPTVYFLRVFP